MAQKLRVYRLQPTAPVDDPNWDNSPNQGEVVVRAASTGDARFVAAQAEGDFSQISSKPAEGVSTLNASAFLNEKLYTVLEEEGSQFDPNGERAVLFGDILSPLADENGNRRSTARR